MNYLQELLYKSYDQELSESEKQELEQGLIEHEALMEEKLSLDNMREKLSGFETAFEPGFADQVMNEVQLEGSADEVSLRFALSIFKRVVYSGVAAVILFLISIYLTDGSLSLDSLSGLADYTAYEAELAFFDYN